jgi:hypothetical protein
LVIKEFYYIFAAHFTMAAMKREYTKPELRAVDLSLETTFCLSSVDGTGGSLSGYGEDDENIFG